MTRAEKIAALQTMQANGEQVFTAQVLAVYWGSPDGTKYYASIATDKTNPYRNIPVSNVEPRLNKGEAEFIPFRIASDLTSEDISVSLSEINRSGSIAVNDLEIQRLYSIHGAGTKVELFYYYPQVDLFESKWFGHLSGVDSSNRLSFNIRASNGFMSRAMIAPKNSFYESCMSTFGGFLTTQAEIDENPCPYNRQISGGLTGNLNSGSPYTSCPKTEAGCTARLGNKDSFYGYSITASPTVYDSKGRLAYSRGNLSNLVRPLRRIYGYKTIRDLDLVIWKREPNAKHPDKGWVVGLWMISDGQISSMYDFRLNDAPVGLEHIAYRYGQFRQGRTFYANDVSNFSGRAHICARVGWVNANETDLTTFKSQITVVGSSDIRVYSDEDTYSKIFTNNRVWCLMDVYANKNVMNGYDYPRFNITDWGNAANWCDTTVTFTDVNGTGYTHRRTQFDCDMQGRQSDEHIRDICVSGRLSIPFQHDGKITIVPLTKVDTSSVKTFTDSGKNRNIEVNEQGIAEITLFQKDPKELYTDVILTFEDSANGDIVRPLRVEDEKQQYRAGRAFGDAGKRNIELRRGAYGIRYFDEAVKLAHALLYLGELDEGGVKNNLRITFQINHVHALDLKKYDVIKVETSLLDNYLGSDILGLEDFNEPFFRITDLKQETDGRVTVTGWAYPKDYYDTFETEYAPEDTLPVDSGHPLITDVWYPSYTKNPTSPSDIQIDYLNGFLQIEVINA